MIRDGNDTYPGEHCVTYRIIKSICCTPEINTTLYINYNLIKERKEAQSVLYLEVHLPLPESVNMKKSHFLPVLVMAWF